MYPVFIMKVLKLCGHYDLELEFFTNDSTKVTVVDFKSLMYFKIQ